MIALKEDSFWLFFCFNKFFIMSKIVEDSKKYFFNKISKYKEDPYGLLNYVPEVEKWSKYMLKKYKDANRDVVLASSSLHDIGHYPLQRKEDHAVIGEKISKSFLKNKKIREEKVGQILHCIRAHRCRDVMPNSIEAKIVAFSDSASHITDCLYFDIAKKNKKTKTLFLKRLKEI